MDKCAHTVTTEHTYWSCRIPVPSHKKIENTDLHKFNLTHFVLFKSTQQPHNTFANQCRDNLRNIDFGNQGV